MITDHGRWARHHFQPGRSHSKDGAYRRQPEDGRLHCPDHAGTPELFWKTMVSAPFLTCAASIIVFLSTVPLAPVTSILSPFSNLVVSFWMNDSGPSCTGIDSASVARFR